ncbi:MAG TPA: 3-isopropylmalate dehydratase small subunit [Paraburkholderia sp.]|jgi:3-isopropylmalate/(R)-2-methylmalate dehydratase small subunit|nr:3-isopropylmalate dehydratase small subunit [Paraburkholderia sp.]
MKPFTVVEGIAAPLPAADIDTDQILPARFMHEPRVDYGRYCFHDLRFDAQSGARREGFVLNRAPFAAATLLVAGSNFGCGSSREQAVHTLADYGIRALIAAGFGDIFATNCLKNGLLPVRVAHALADALLRQIETQPGLRVCIDLPAQTVSAAGGWHTQFDIDPFYKEALLAGRDEIDTTLLLAAQIDAYEAQRIRASAPVAVATRIGRSFQGNT